MPEKISCNENNLLMQQKKSPIANSPPFFHQSSLHATPLHPHVHVVIVDGSSWDYTKGGGIARVVYDPWGD
jgi:hypothetical protein